MAWVKDPRSYAHSCVQTTTSGSWIPFLVTTHIFTSNQSFGQHCSLGWFLNIVTLYFPSKLTCHTAPLPPRVQILQNTSVWSKPICKVYLLPMYLRELHVQEGKRLSWIPFLLYFTHGSYDLIEGGLSQLAYVKISVFHFLEPHHI